MLERKGPTSSSSAGRSTKGHACFAAGWPAAGAVRLAPRWSRWWSSLSTTRGSGRAGSTSRRASPRSLPPRTVAYIDALYAAVLGLALVDVVEGGSLIVRFLVVALRTGHRAAIAAAALLGAGQLAARGGPESDRERALVALAARAAETERQSPSAQSAQATHAFRHFLRGKWRQAHELFETAYTTLPPSRDALEPARDRGVRRVRPGLPGRAGARGPASAASPGRRRAARRRAEDREPEHRRRADRAPRRTTIRVGARRRHRRPRSRTGRSRGS